MQIPDTSKITVDRVELTLCRSKKIEWDVLRLDKIHPVISGNKWFKLKYHLEKMKENRDTGFVTFGGAWSNHLLAAACAAKIEAVPAAGCVRGEQPAVLSDTLKQCIQYGMQLHFLTRSFYRQLKTGEARSYVTDHFPGFYIIPEGGAGECGEKGCREIISLSGSTEYSHIACAVGTGTMLAGLVNASFPQQQIIGIPVLKGGGSLNNSFHALIPGDKLTRCRFYNDYHFGGYARHPPELIHFMNDFYKDTGIPTDFVYTGKLAFALMDLIHRNLFPPGSRILMIHSGGLQGNVSLPNGALMF